MKNFPPLTQKQKEIIAGTILGDAHITSKSPRLVINHSMEQAEYIDFFYEELMPFSSYRKPYFDPRGFRGISFATYTSQSMKELRAEWYPHGIKIVPATIELTPLTIAIWFCDDGTNTEKYSRLRLSTDGFSYQDVEFLVDKLNDFNIKATIKKSRNVISVKSISTKNFIELVRPYIPWACMRYKLRYDEGIKRMPEYCGVFIDPLGKEHHVTKLRQFAKEHGLLASSLSKLASGKKKTHHGWRWAS